MKKILLAFIMIGLFSSGQAFPCTGIFFNKDQVKLIGRTMDWPTGDGYVSINERGIRKQADSIQDKSPRIEWASKYGSVTFRSVSTKYFRRVYRSWRIGSDNTVPRGT